MLPDHRWDINNSNRYRMDIHRKVMVPREDIMARRGCMDSLRDSIWIIGGEGIWGLRRLCVRVWRVVVVWMLVCCFRAVQIIWGWEDVRRGSVYT
jgi:hypothetical protein